MNIRAEHYTVSKTTLFSSKVINTQKVGRNPPDVLTTGKIIPEFDLMQKKTKTKNKQTHMYLPEPQLWFKMQEVLVLDVNNPNTTDLEWKCGGKKWFGRQPQHLLTE